MRSLIISGCALLAACASAPPKVVTVEKPVQVAVPVVARCDVTVSPDPAYPDTDAAISNANSLTDLARMYRAGRALRDARIAYLKALLAQCVG